MKFLYLLLLAFTFVNTSAQELEIYERFEDFEAALMPDQEKVYVINYWATWCAPCVKELPHFEKLGAEYSNRDVEVVLVSLDFENMRERSLIPFIKRKNLKSRLIHLADPKTNNWIDKVNKSWSGALPATIIAFQGKEEFKEGDISSYEELETKLQKFIKANYSKS